jgi:hypothetical protein
MIKVFNVITEPSITVTRSLIIVYLIRVFPSNYIGLKLGFHLQMARNSSIKDEATMDRSLVTRLRPGQLKKGYLCLALYLISEILYLVLWASHFPACNASLLCLPVNF